MANRAIRLTICNKEGMPVITDLQRASMLKRISAWLLDTILLVIAATLMALILSAALGYDRYGDMLEARYAWYESEYGVSRNLTQADVDAMTDAQRANLQAASEALAQDEEANYAYNMVVQLLIVITSIGILLAYLAMEFAVPMLLKNGQTIGKKVFGIAVMRSDSIRINGVCLFIRTVLGKYTIETMIPVMMLLMLYFGAIGEVGLLVLGAVLIVNAALILFTRERTPIHDKLANTVTVDLASQMIFDTHADMIAYVEKEHARKAAETAYP